MIIIYLIYVSMNFLLYNWNDLWLNGLRFPSIDTHLSTFPHVFSFFYKWNSRYIFTTPNRHRNPFLHYNKALCRRSPTPTPPTIIFDSLLSIATSSQRKFKSEIKQHDRTEWIELGIAGWLNKWPTGWMDGWMNSLMKQEPVPRFAVRGPWSLNAMPGSWHSIRSTRKSITQKPPLPTYRFIFQFYGSTTTTLRSVFRGVEGGVQNRGGVPIQLPQCGKAIDLSAA